jgi:ubiquinone/menaquinone biosynthesis C-methylase UbiE
MLAHNYADNYDLSLNNAFFTALKIKTIKKWASIYLKGFLLDFGCGTGENNQFLFSPNSVGIDINFQMLREYKKKFPKKDLIQCDAENLPLKNNIFDCVLSAGTFHHLNNAPQGMKEINRILKNSGHLCSFEMQNSDADSFLEFVLLLLFGKPKQIKKNVKNINPNHPGHEGKKYIPKIFVESKKFGFDLQELYCINHQWIPFRRFWNNKEFVWKIIFTGSKFFDKIPTVKLKGSIVTAILKKTN